MSTKEIDLMTACDRIELFAQEGRLAGGKWHNKRDGREIACIYGSIDPSINSVDDCPSSLGPSWMHELVVKLFDGLADDDTRNAYGLRYAQVLRKTGELSPERWETVRIEFVCIIIELMVNSAKTVAEDARYWSAVNSACQQVKQAFRGDGNMASAKAAASAADYVACSAKNDAALDADTVAYFAAREACRVINAVARAGLYPRAAIIILVSAVTNAPDRSASAGLVFAVLFNTLIDLIEQSE